VRASDTEERIDAFRQTHQEYFNYKNVNTAEAIGKLKIEFKSLPERMANRYVYYKENVYQSPDIPIPNVITVKNEFDRDEISDIIKNNDRLIVKANVAGAGKTSSFIHYANKTKSKLLFVTP
jgi:superfamily II DNA or RNA helicase